MLSCSPDLLKLALDVLDGKAANITARQTPLAAKVCEGTIFLARAVEVNNSEAAHWCPILEGIERFDYEEGQHDGEWSGVFTATAVCAPVAEDLKKVAEGFWALLAIHSSGQPKLTEMFHHVHTSLDRKVVTVTFHESTDELAAQMPSICKFAAEHMKMHLHGMHQEHAAGACKPQGQASPMKGPGHVMEGKTEKNQGTGRK